MNGWPTDDQLAAIEAELPETERLQEMMTAFRPDLVFTRFPPGSRIPLAVVCLIDAERMLAEARYALLQATAHARYPIPEGNPWLSSFFSADVALRLYAAGEHLAYAIVAMMQIEESQLEPYKKGVQSRQCLVGKYLAKQLATHPITQAVSALHTTTEWARARKYRDEWVHQQAPLLDGIGAVWRRAERWTRVREGVYKIGIGSGDAPAITATELVSVVQGAFVAFVIATERVVCWYHERLAERGIRRPADGSVQVDLLAR